MKLCAAVAAEGYSGLVAAESTMSHTSAAQPSVISPNCLAAALAHVPLSNSSVVVGCSSVVADPPAVELAGAELVCPKPVVLLVSPIVVVEDPLSVALGPAVVVPALVVPESSPLVVCPSTLDDVPSLLLLLLLVVVVVVISCSNTSAEAPSTAERLPVTLTERLLSPRALDACDRNGVLLDRLDRLSAAAPTCESSELMLSSSVTVPVVAARRRPKLPPTTLMLTAPGGS
mmetsp:Transcript_54124/g.110109  ORF Transcript_54124/g.110109 Transcript_54124/m.110109 type:complete len:231 (-) Transcript_54124:1084-1776(-)